MKALRQFQQKLIEGNVSIYVRRAGPNYQEGLRIMRELGMWAGLNYHQIKAQDYRRSRYVGGENHQRAGDQNCSGLN